MFDLIVALAGACRDVPEGVTPEVRATTPHGSYTFKVDRITKSITGDVTLHLEEVDRK